MLLCHPTAGLLLVELFKTSGAQQEVVCDFDLLLGLATSFATSPGDDCFVKWMRMSWRFSFAYPAYYWFSFFQCLL